MFNMVIKLLIILCILIALLIVIPLTAESFVIFYQIPPVIKRIAFLKADIDLILLVMFIICGSLCSVVLIQILFTILQLFLVELQLFLVDISNIFKSMREYFNSKKENVLETEILDDKEE